MSGPEPACEAEVALSGRRTDGLARLQLVRLPNLFTAMADVLAGYLIVAGLRIDGGTLLGLLAASSCLYAGGCVLNDIRDRRTDARERPFRPLPSGRVSLGEAKTLCAVLFVLGLAAALAAGRPAFAVAVVLLLLILSYDLSTKGRSLLGPANMGACRAANLLLGMAPALGMAGTALILPAISFAYVFLLTRLSRFEVEGDPRLRLTGIGAGLLLLMILLATLVGGGTLGGGSLPFLALLILLSGPPLWRGISRPQPALVGRAVKMLILCLPLLDAFYAAGVHGLGFGIPVALLLVPSLLLARVLYVT